ncbi:glycosyltransferase family 4 protein [Azospirillum sp. SYSU D00513]|uniref:glycosyltransferase family 4 protein n=1 Tax=Azospirillum sp. SYSU D00513 TaxID=2812561 RepID=UPI001A96F573|nr:glycosyltransferase family 4 protein [Azospirillum sp. SYSU D00513]
MRMLAVSGNLDYSGSSLCLYRFLKTVTPEHSADLLWGQLGPPSLKGAYEAAGIRVMTEAALDSYDVVLCNSLLTGHLLQRCAARRPVLWWIHEPQFGAAMVRAGRFSPEAFAAATTIVFPTRWQATEVYREWLTRENWTIVENGAAVDPSPRPRPQEVVPGFFNILQLGAVELRKGTDLTLAAVRRLADPAVRLIYVGPRHPNFSPSLTAEEKTRIVFAGPKTEEQVAAYLQHCDALSVPTRDDLVALAIMEALQVGLPVASSDYGPIPETIRHDWNGLMSPVGNAEKLAENLARLRDNPALRHRLAANGQQTYRERHNAAQSRDRLLRALADTIAKGRA